MLKNNTFLKKEKTKLAKWNLTVQTFSLVHTPAASRFPPNISVHNNQQNTSGDLFHPQNVFSVSTRYLSPACPVKMSQQRKLKRKTASRFHWRKRGHSVPSCSLSASFNICTNEKETKNLAKVCKPEICSFFPTQTFFYYQCKWGRHDRQHQITLRSASCSGDTGSRDRKQLQTQLKSWLLFRLQLQEVTRWFFYPFELCKVKWGGVKLQKKRVKFCRWNPRSVEHQRSFHDKQP